MNTTTVEPAESTGHKFSSSKAAALFLDRVNTNQNDAAQYLVDDRTVTYTAPGSYSLRDARTAVELVAHEMRSFDAGFQAALALVG